MQPIRRRRCWRRRWWFGAVELMLVQTTCTLASVVQIEEEEVVLDPLGMDSSRSRRRHRRRQNPLRPTDLPPIRVFSNWTTSSQHHHHHNNNNNWTVHTGSIPQAGQGDFRSELDWLEGIVTRTEVTRMLELLEAVPTLDTDPDTVDGFATQEIFVDNPSLRQEGGQAGGKPDHLESPQQVHERRQIRQKLLQITEPILRDRIVPFVRQRFPAVCNTTTNTNTTTTTRTPRQRQRLCTPCYSLVRRYQHGARQSHAPHRDGHALVTVVVSLSDYGTEYTGGLYVMGQQHTNQRYYLGLRRGDAAVHQSDLWHGVQVWAGSTAHRRWSWILWFHDTEQCDDDNNDHQHEWFVECAKAGNPTCEYLHATKVGSTPGLSDPAAQVIYWNRRAAQHGHPTASVKLARAYLGLLPSSGLLPYNRTAARQWYQRAVDSSHDPDAHYGLASMLLQDLASSTGASSPLQQQQAVLLQVIEHLEESAAGGHPFAMFNLGMVHLYGFATTEQDTQLAAAWFEASGLPEGLAAAAMYYASQVGGQQKASDLQRCALQLGYGTPWRVLAREKTGYGGAAGIDLNLAWPPNAQGQVPPKW